MHPRFGLVLMVNHACNLRCAYCYTGAKFHRPMPEGVGCRAIDRVVASLAPGGTPVPPGRNSNGPRAVLRVMRALDRRHE